MLLPENKSLRDKIDANYTSRNGKLDETSGELRGEMKQIRAEIDKMYISIAELKGAQKGTYFILIALGHQGRSQRRYLNVANGTASCGLTALSGANRYRDAGQDNSRP
jgi:hypothetical protein